MASSAAHVPPIHRILYKSAWQLLRNPANTNKLAPMKTTSLAKVAASIGLVVRTQVPLRDEPMPVLSSPTAS